MTPLFLIAIAALVIGVLLTLRGKQERQTHGLTDAPTLDLNGRTLFSARLKLSGRPDRTVTEGGMSIPEEWKPSARRVYDSHRAQIGCYFILIEEETGVRPTHGFISLESGERVRIENTPELRALVLDVADQIRVARSDLSREIPVRQPPAKCRGCGMREGCGQRRG